MKISDGGISPKILIKVNDTANINSHSSDLHNWAKHLTFDIHLSTLRRENLTIIYNKSMHVNCFGVHRKHLNYFAWSNLYIVIVTNSHDVEHNACT